MSNTPAIQLVNVAELEQMLEKLVRGNMRAEVEKLIEPRFLDTKAVGAMLGCSRKTVVRLIAEEGLPTARSLGRELRFERDRVVEWMRGQVESGTPRLEMVKK